MEGKMRILLISGKSGSDCLFAYRDLLAEKGHEVALELSLPHGIRRLKEEKFDIALSAKHPVRNMDVKASLSELSRTLSPLVGDRVLRAAVVTDFFFEQEWKCLRSHGLTGFESGCLAELYAFCEG